MTDHEGGDMSDDIPNWDWVSIEEKDAEIAKLKAELEEAREIMNALLFGGDSLGVVRDVIYAPRDAVYAARTFLKKAGK